MNSLYETPRRRSVTIAYALFVAVLAVFSLTASYDKGADFVSGTVMIGSVFNTMVLNGAITSAVLFAAVFCISLGGMHVARYASKRIRRWSLGIASLIACSLAVPPFVPEGKAVSFTVMHVFPALSSGEKTQWYWLFMGTRYVGYLLFAYILLCALFTLSARDGEASQWNAHDRAKIQTGIDWVCRQTAVITRWKPAGWLRTLLSTFSVKSVGVVSLVLAVLWLPWMVLLYPVNIAADTVAQLVWARGDYPVWDPSSRQDIPWARMSDHHPWFDTVIYGWFDRLGVSLGDEAYGLYALAVLQTLLCAFSVAVLVCYIGGRLLLNWKWCAVGVAWYGVIPIFGRLSMSVVKDSTFMPFFIMWLVFFMEYIHRIRAKEHIGVWIPLGIVLLAIVCALTKKTGLYVIVFSLVVLAVFLQRRLISVVCIMLIAIGFQGIDAIAFPALHVAPAGKQEVLAIPLQQTANLVMVHGGDLSKHDRDVVGRVFTCDTKQMSELYDLQDSVPIKDNCFNRSATNKDISEFLLTWLKEGFLHPRTYVDATPWMRDSFTLGSIYDEGFYVHWGWSDKGGLSILPQYKEGEKSTPQRYGSALYYMLARMPTFSLLMSEWFYVVFIPLISIALCFLRHRWRNLFYAIPLLISIPLLLISPAHQTRYSWSLAYGFFVFIMAAWKPDEYVEQPPKEINGRH